MTKIGKQYNCSPARVALSWIKDKPGVASVIIGAKNIDQLLDNVACTELKLSEEDLKKLEEVSALTPEYPGWMINRQLSGRFPEMK